MTEQTYFLIGLSVSVLLGFVYVIYLARKEKKQELKRMEEVLKENEAYREAKKRKFEANAEMIKAEHLMRMQQEEWRRINDERKWNKKKK